MSSVGPAVFAAVACTPETVRVAAGAIFGMTLRMTRGTMMRDMSVRDCAAAEEKTNLYQLICSVCTSSTGEVDGACPADSGRSDGAPTSGNRKS